MEGATIDRTSSRLRACLHREQRIADIQREIKRLEAEIVALAAETHNDRSHVLTGAVTTTEWLVAATNVTARTARRWVRVATKVHELPAVADAMHRGDVGVEQVAALLRFVEPDDPVEIQQDYFDVTADELAEVARHNRTVPPERVRQHRFDRYHVGRYSDNGLMYEYEGALPAADGALLDCAVRRLAARDRIDEHGDCKLVDHAHADAVVEMPSQALGRESDRIVRRWWSTSTPLPSARTSGSVASRRMLPSRCRRCDGCCATGVLSPRSTLVMARRSVSVACSARSRPVGRGWCATGIGSAGFRDVAVAAGCTATT